MSFFNPQLFWILIVPLLFFTFYILRYKEKFLEIFDEKVLERLSIADDSLPLSLRNSMILIAIFLMLVALARPVIDNGDRVVSLEGLSVLVALDISGSMRAEDIYPNRLEFAKKKIVNLLEEMPQDELSLIAFAHSSFMLAPFSSDKTSLNQIVEGISTNYINMGSTDFQALAEFSAKILKKKKQKILILFSDGGDKEDLLKFRKIIKKENISLYVVLVGTTQGSPVIGEDNKALKIDGKLIITQRNDELGEVAMNNKGAFIVANTGSSDIYDLVATMKNHHKSKIKGEIVLHDRVELFYYPLGLGLLILLFSFISLPKFKDK